MSTLINWIEAMNPSLQVFWGISIVASIVFGFQLIMTMIGLDADTDVDTGSGNLDGGLDADFALFSFRSIVAFFLFFGWTGVMILQNGGSLTKAIAVAFIAGAIAMSVIAYLLFQIYKMEESGTVNLDNAIGKNAEVYLPIPSALNGKGKVQIEIENKIMELAAVTKNETLSTGNKVLVIDVLENNVLLVETL